MNGTADNILRVCHNPAACLVLLGNPAVMVARRMAPITWARTRPCHNNSHNHSTHHLCVMIGLIPFKHVPPRLPMSLCVCVCGSCPGCGLIITDRVHSFDPVVKPAGLLNTLVSSSSSSSPQHPSVIQVRSAESNNTRSLNPYPYQGVGDDQQPPGYSSP